MNDTSVKPFVIEVKGNLGVESPKIRNRRSRKKEAARLVGEELIKAYIDLKINEISSYNQNGNARGERMQAIETAIAQHGF